MIAGNFLFESLHNQKCIILACNPRIIPGVAKGIFKASKELDAALIMELARTECNQHTGYTGLTPKSFSRFLQEANEEIMHDIWTLHADHIQIKKGDNEEIDDVKDLIKNQITSGYQSFCIDASHLFNFEGKTVEEELEPNIKATIEIANFIKKTMRGHFGLEVEVGEIGRKDEHGLVLTKPEEAVTFIRKLKENNIKPHLLAIANGSIHGNVYDKKGKLISQTTIDIKQTKKVAKALRDSGFDVRIAQHGITGTPLDFIEKKFPKGDILKGNVATLFQNIVFDNIKRFKQKLYREIVSWTLQNHPIEGKGEEEIFGKNGKYAIKQFFDDIHSLPDECVAEIEKESYTQAKLHIKAFNSVGTAKYVREHMR